MSLSVQRLTSERDLLLGGVSPSYTQEELVPQLLVRIEALERAMGGLVHLPHALDETTQRIDRLEEKTDKIEQLQTVQKKSGSGLLGALLRIVALVVLIACAIIFVNRYNVSMSANTPHLI